MTVRALELKPTYGSRLFSALFSGLFYFAVFLVFLAPLLRLLAMSFTEEAGYSFSHTPGSSPKAEQGRPYSIR
jgi:ABC-type spermidine/putrescine transport system permease subunit II